MQLPRTYLLCAPSAQSTAGIGFGQPEQSIWILSPSSLLKSGRFCGIRLWLLWLWRASKIAVSRWVCRRSQRESRELLSSDDFCNHLSGSSASRVRWTAADGNIELHCEQISTAGDCVLILLGISRRFRSVGELGEVAMGWIVCKRQPEPGNGKLLMARTTNALLKG